MFRGDAPAGGNASHAADDFPRRINPVSFSLEFNHRVCHWLGLHFVESILQSHQPRRNRAEAGHGVDIAAIFHQKLTKTHDIINPLREEFQLFLLQRQDLFFLMPSGLDLAEEFCLPGIASIQGLEYLPDLIFGDRGLLAN